ncbi:MAG: hypothetical protein IPJ81_17920 [Chitinophagaceae bacterium]|nr:hypothetical protein [Chitinophagaceae bacterium]
MHKFLLAENPQAPSTGGLWIIHLLDPICIIEAVISGEKIHTKKAIYTKDFKFTNSDEILEHWQLRLHHYFTTDFDEQKEAAILTEKIMTEAWHWFKAYLIWEDANIDNG